MRTLTACPACRTAVPAGVRDCLRCGHAVAEPVRRCPACKRPAGATARFCAHCGQRLDEPPLDEQPPAGEHDAPQVPVDATDVILQPRSYRRHVLVGVIVVGAVVVALCAVQAVEWLFFRPQHTVSAYFDALAARDAAAAGRLLDDGGDDGVAAAVLGPEALTSDGYTPPADVRIRGVQTSDDIAYVEVSFELGGERRDLTLHLRRDGRRIAGLFDRWRILDGRYPVSVRAPGLDAVVVAGVPVPFPEGAHEVTVAAFPGAYSVALPEHPLFTAAEATLYAPGVVSEDFDPTVEIIPAITPTGRDEVERQVRAYLDACADRTELAPEDCPFSMFTYGDVRSVRWQIDRYPTISVAVDARGRGAFVVETITRGFAVAVWEEVAWDGSAVEHTDEVAFSVSGIVTVSGGRATFRPVG